MSATNDWRPLELLLDPGRCVGFMFMGRLSNGITQYKHGISRQYLFLDDHGRAYQRTANGCFRRIATVEALAGIEESLRAMGETLQTPYDSEYRRRRDRALSAAGFEVLRLQILPDA